ncbi:hypothetical protein IQ07DRAFT_599374 [Pyrenochaeta sp. DS3sAY3a]|nr:hypothetical protein IQ07DRAFT_599374 [Pyrenochaeta sp. DS3sAY3a]
MSKCPDLYPASSCSHAKYWEWTLVGVQPEPSCGRGTVGIIWTCLTVMFFSAWSVISLDTRPLPGPFTRKARSVMEKPLCKIMKRDLAEMRSMPLFGPTSRKFLEASIILLFPEYSVLIAVEEFTVARYIQHRTREINDWEEFSLRQAHLVRMGGIYIPQISTPEEFPVFVAQNTHVMDYSRFPTNAQINLRAKRDIFDKLVTLPQTLYFICTIAIRNNRHFIISYLEVLTLNYVCYAFITFLLRLGKPQELYEPFDLDLAELPSPTHPVGKDDSRRPRLERWIWLGMIASIAVVGTIPFIAFSQRRTFWFLSEDKSSESDATFVALVGLIAILVFMSGRSIENRPWKEGNIFQIVAWYLGVATMYLGGLVYAAFRVFIVYRVFENFKYTPDGVYLTPDFWSQYLPHVGS